MSVYDELFRDEDFVVINRAVQLRVVLRPRVCLAAVGFRECPVLHPSTKVVLQLSLVSDVHSVLLLSAQALRAERDVEILTAEQLRVELRCREVHVNYASSHPRVPSPFFQVAVRLLWPEPSAKLCKRVGPSWIRLFPTLTHPLRLSVRAQN